MGIYLETSRLWLHPFSLVDADNLHRIWIKPAVRKYLWDNEIISRDTVVEIIQASEKSFAEHAFGFWTLNGKDSQQVLGFCGLRHFLEDGASNTQVEILYGLLPRYWGHGLATEAAQQVLHYGFEQVGLKAIFAGADSPNGASFRVMERLGMKFLRQTTIGGLSAIYYVLNQDQFYPGVEVFKAEDHEQA